MKGLSTITKKIQSLGPDFNQARLLSGTHLDDKSFTLIAHIIVI